MKVLVYQFHVMPEKNEHAVRTPYWMYSFHTVEKYCARHGFDYEQEVVEENDYTPHLFNHYYFEYFKILKKLEEYDTIIYLDSDVVITKDAPNLAEVYKNYPGIGCFWHTAGNYTNPQQTGILPVWNHRPLNSGVLVFNRTTYRADFLLHEWPEEYMSETSWLDALSRYEWMCKRRTPGGFNVHCDETFLSKIIHVMQIPTFHIDIVWNWWISDSNHRKLDVQKQKVKNDHAFFIHMGGDGKRHAAKVYELYC